MLYTHHDSPIGRLLLAGDERGLRGLYTDGHKGGPTVGHDWTQRDAFSDVRRQLDQYFAGRRRRFDVAIVEEGTPFQRAVWAALVRIPFGRTSSYGAVAHELGKPSSSRAVGAANGRNPISIIVPCHRVLGADGSLTGYAGGEARKRWLLEHEARVGAT